MKTIVFFISLFLSLNLYSQQLNFGREYELRQERKKYDEEQVLQKMKIKFTIFVKVRNELVNHYQLGDFNPTFRSWKKENEYWANYRKTTNNLRRAEIYAKSDYLNSYRLIKRLEYSWYKKFPIRLLSADDIYYCLQNNITCQDYNQEEIDSINNERKNQLIKSLTEDDFNENGEYIDGTIIIRKRKTSTKKELSEEDLEKRKKEEQWLKILKEKGLIEKEK